jgi:hypothetical protein
MSRSLGDADSVSQLPITLSVMDSLDDDLVSLESLKTAHSWSPWDAQAVVQLEATSDRPITVEIPIHRHMKFKVCFVFSDCYGKNRVVLSFAPCLRRRSPPSPLSWTLSVARHSSCIAVLEKVELAWFGSAQNRCGRSRSHRFSTASPAVPTPRSFCSDAPRQWTQHVDFPRQLSPQRGGRLSRMEARCLRSRICWRSATILAHTRWCCATLCQRHCEPFNTSGRKASLS